MLQSVSNPIEDPVTDSNIHETEEQFEDDLESLSVGSSSYLEDAELIEVFSDDGSESARSSATDDLSDQQEFDYDLPDCDDEVDVDMKMFEPLYDGASITICGAYCALMEFKRACRLPFTTIDMLLQLLQLFCPSNNKLPRSVYKFKKFFEQFASSHQKRQFCSDCVKEFSKCDNPDCRSTEPNTLISFDPTKAIRRVLKSKSYSN